MSCVNVGVSYGGTTNNVVILDVINPFTAFGAAQKPITVSEQLNNQSPKTGELLQSYLDREEAKRVEQKEKETTQALEQIEEKPLKMRVPKKHPKNHSKN